MCSGVSGKNITTAPPLCTYIIFCVDENVVEFEDDGVGSLVGRWQHVREKLGTRGLSKCLKIQGNGIIVV